MKTYKAAIIGYGGMGNWHRKGICITPRIKITGAFDILPEKEEAVTKDGLVWYPSQAALLADPAVDIVIVATPNNYHCEIVCAALEAGKAVVCEKPVAMDSAELQTMMDCAARTGSLFTIHQNRRRDADFRAVRDAVESGGLGQVFAVESRVTGSRGIPHGWRRQLITGGGMMLDWGVHMIDQLMQLFPQKVVSVFCELYHVGYVECDDGFRLLIKFEGGPTCEVEVGTTHFIQPPRWRVYGDKGAITVNDWNGSGKIVRAIETEEVWEEEIVYTKAGPTKTMAPRHEDTVSETEIDPDQYHSDHPGFYVNLAEVLDGAAEPFVRPEEAMRVMKVMEAAFESDRTGQAVLGDI
ncbi:MAG: Gfo/Idh/MocA family oxidoreductase [Oscillospiraceae bacterium]|nr:Gfo/Idh/MocA family oxidoreductase [Oscillospiraceae bacterium]